MATDESLAIEAAGGRSGSFALLVDRYAAQVVSVVERSVGDHHLARDLTQEIWMKVHRGLPRFERHRRFRPWLFAIAMNHIRDNRRKAGRRAKPLGLDDLAGDPAKPGFEEFDRNSERDEIEAALGCVPELYRNAVHLVDVLGLGYDEAGESLGCNPGTVKSRVHRGRQAFQSAYIERSEGGTNTQKQL